MAVIPDMALQRACRVPGDREWLLTGSMGSPQHRRISLGGISHAQNAYPETRLTRLRQLEQDVRWGGVAIEPERAERLRQYLAGRSEIGAGDQLVLRSLRRKARERQRFVLGLPPLLIGGGGFFALVRRRAAD